MKAQFFNVNYYENIGLNIELWSNQPNKSMLKLSYSGYGSGFFSSFLG